MDIQREFEVPIVAAVRVVARRLDDKTGSYGPWCICTLVWSRRKKIKALTFVRACSSEESDRLDAAYHSNRLVLRHTTPTAGGRPWSLAYP